MTKKSSNLILRVSTEWKNDLRKICRNKGRSMTGHIEHAFKLAKLVTDFCDGNDDIEYVEWLFNELKKRKLVKHEASPAFLLAAETGQTLKLPYEKKVTYRKKRAASHA